MTGPLSLLVLQAVLAVSPIPAVPQDRGEVPTPELAGSVCLREDVVFELDSALELSQDLELADVIQDPRGQIWGVLWERQPRGDVQAARAVPLETSGTSMSIDLLGSLADCIYPTRPTWNGESVATGWVCRPPESAGQVVEIRSYVVSSRQGGSGLADELCAGGRASCLVRTVSGTSPNSLWVTWSAPEGGLWAYPILSGLQEESEPLLVTSAISRRRTETGVAAQALGEQLLVAVAQAGGEGKESIVLHRIAPEGAIGEAMAVSSTARSAQGWVDLALGPGGRAALVWLWEQGLSGGPPMAFGRVVAWAQGEALTAEQPISDSPDPSPILAAKVSRLGETFVVGWLERGQRGGTVLRIRELNPRHGVVGESWLISEQVMPTRFGRYRTARSELFWLFDGAVVWTEESRNSRGGRAVHRCVIDVDRLRGGTEPDSPALQDD